MKQRSIPVGIYFNEPSSPHQRRLIYSLLSILPFQLLNLDNNRFYGIDAAFVCSVAVSTLLIKPMINAFGPLD